MERPKEESQFLAPCALWPVELKLTHIDCSPEHMLVHFQGQYLTICELDYNILQVEIQNAVKTKVLAEIGEHCLVEDPQSGRWYRGRVQDVQEDLFHVFLLDHGDVLSVGPSHLSKMSDTLQMLPPKIVCGFFANILPFQKQWNSLTENYFSSLIGSQINGYIHARLPYQVLILEVSDIKSDLLKLKLARHVDTSTFLLLVEMLIEVPIQQSNESVPDLLIEKQMGPEYCLKSSSLLGFEKILSLNGPKLKVGQKVKVVVTAAINPGMFYCRLTSMGEDVQKMSQKLALVCESGSGSLSNKSLENLGLLCAVKGKDEQWHRGFVQCLPVNSQVRVVFIDSGYCESVKVENILQLPSEFLSTPIMAVPCSLSCLNEKDDPVKKQQLEFLKSALLGRTLEIVIDGFCKDQNFYLVTLSTSENFSEAQMENIQKLDRGENFERLKSSCPQTISSKGYATETKIQTSGSVPSEEIREGSLFEGNVVHVQNPKHFWIRTKAQNAKFEKMMNEMTDYFNRVQLNEEIFEDPVPGALCCAMYENDMHYYRALVVDTLENGAEVFFIDFGNTEKVPSMLIKILPRRFAVQPEFALNCALAYVAPSQDIWTTVASDFFRQVTSNKTLLVHVVHKRNGKYIVDLFKEGDANGNNIATIMTTANMAVNWSYNPTSVSVPLKKQKENKKNSSGKKTLKNNIYVVKSQNDMSPEVKSECAQENVVKSPAAIEMTKPKIIATEIFKPIHFKPGCEINVICSHTNSPSDFWCQNKSTKGNLDKMMEELQIFYQTYTVMLESPAVCCAVKYSQDNRWHRACVLGERKEELYVILVDSGVVIKERMENIRALAPQFLDLQEQAFRCSLEFIEPAGGSSWSVEACHLFKDFMCEDSTGLICQINSQLYEQGKGLFNVVDIHKSFQLATKFLVDKGVAVEIQTPKQLVSSVYPRSFVYSSFDVSSGSEELVHVTTVCSPWEIYFQLDRNAEIMEKLMDRIAEESQLLSTTSENCSGNVCLARYFCDGQWYRAMMQPVRSHQHVSVFFVDYGDYQISEKNNIMTIPRRAVDLLLTPMQALRCSLSNIPDGEHLPEVKMWLETAILNQSLQAKFVTKDNNGHFLCDLYDGNVHINEKVRELMATYSMKVCDPSVSKSAFDSHKEQANFDFSGTIDSKEGSQGKIQLASKQTVKPVHPTKTECKMPVKRMVQVEQPNISCCAKEVPFHQNLPKLTDLPDIKMKPGSRGVGIISHCSSSRYFFVQMEEDEPNILQMGKELNSTFFKSNLTRITSEVKVGDLVAAKYAEDKALYRAVVIKVFSGHLVVKFVDYGNTTDVEKKNVYALTSVFLSQPRLSTPCTLANTHSFNNEESFVKEAVGKPLMITFIYKLGKVWKVNIQILGDGHKHDGNKRKCAVLPLKGQDKWKTVPQDKNKMYDSYKPNTKVKGMEKSKCELNNNQTFAAKPKKKAATFLPTLENPKWVGNGKCKKTQNASKQETKSKVLFDTSISVAKSARMLQENVCTSKTNSLEPSVKPPECANLSHDVKKNKSVQNFDVFHVNDHPSLPDTSTESSMDHANLTQTLFHAPVKTNIEYKGVAAAVTTPAEFYVILDDLLLIIDAVSAILESLTEVLVPLPEDHIIPGASCLVESVEKKKWCRAEIVQCNLTSVLINLVDYGLYAVLSQRDVYQLKQLPEELARLPKVTYHCLLRGVKPIGADWSDEAIIFFQNQMCQGNLQIRFRQNVSETQWEVDITTGNQNLAKQLVDSGHALYIDNMLGIRFQQEMEIIVPPCEAEWHQEETFSKTNALNKYMFGEESSQGSDEDQGATNRLNGSDDLESAEIKFSPSSGVKPCALM